MAQRASNPGRREQPNSFGGHPSASPGSVVLAADGWEAHKLVLPRVVDTAAAS
ncbi:hypothetical protein [Nocardia sp. NPDC057440]|uniref:hypothetical protein n=1 Tax=Nocardia sp. NPDC057440 TaxID=3346134 RepID=UPI003671130C